MALLLTFLIASSASIFRSVFQSDGISDHFTVIGVMSFLVPTLPIERLYHTVI